MSDTKASDWFVYIVECADKTFYTGVATDLDRRIEEHNSSKVGARYTRARRPVCLVYSEPCENRSHACKRESAIKKLTRPQKQKLIQNQHGKSTN